MLFVHKAMDAWNGSKLSHHIAASISIKFLTHVIYFILTLTTDCITFICEIYALCNITDLKNYNSYYSPINNKLQVRLIINQILNRVNVWFYRNPFLVIADSY